MNTGRPSLHVASALLGLLVAVVLVTAPLVHAQEADGDVTAEVERLAGEGAEFVAAGDFEQAVVRYLEAHRLAKASALLYNIAFIYDQKLNARDLALEYYQRYLAAEDVVPEIAARALKRSRELMAEAEAEAEAEAKVARASAPVLTPEPAAESGAGGMEIAGYVSLGVGGAALGAGAVFGVVAMGTHDRYKAAVPSERAGIADTGHGQALLADVFLGLGAASAVTGLVLVLLAPDDAEAGEVSWYPTGQVADGGVALGVGGRW